MTIRSCPAVVAVAALALGGRPSLPTLHLDHVPIAVRDFEGAQAQFATLGFTIKPGRPHENGIRNASIKFSDGSYFELITSAHGTDAVAQEYEQLLADQEGAVYVFLRETGDRPFTQRVQAAGGRRETAGPFAFTELPPAWHAPRLQLTEYLSPARDPASIFRHPNGALRIVAVWVALDGRNDRLTREFGAGPARPEAFSFDARPAAKASFADDTCLLLASRRPADPLRSFALGILLEVESFRELTERGAIRSAISRGGARWLPPSEGHGLRLGFIERAAWRSAGCAGSGLTPG